VAADILGPDGDPGQSAEERLTHHLELVEMRSSARLTLDETVEAKRWLSNFSEEHKALLRDEG
jgi:hypothetical protein